MTDYRNIIIVTFIVLWWTLWLLVLPGNAKVLWTKFNKTLIKKKPIHRLCHIHAYKHLKVGGVALLSDIHECDVCRKERNYK